MKAGHRNSAKKTCFSESCFPNEQHRYNNSSTKPSLFNNKFFGHAFPAKLAQKKLHEALIETN